MILTGGKGTQQSFLRGGSTPRSNPLHFYIPFLNSKGTPFEYLLLANGYLLHTEYGPLHPF